MGEDYDPEWGLSHLAHAGFCIMALLASHLRSIGKDDRNKLDKNLIKKTFNLKVRDGKDEEDGI
jgi:hypothetical protein